MGKTTNLQIIHRKIPQEHKSDMVSLATETDRTLFFDFLPLDLGTIKGFSTKFQLYTVPGQVYYNATRKLVLRGVDGVIFVADSAADKMPENFESFQNLEDNLAEYHYKREEVPIIIQYNKRDMPNALSVDELNQQFNKYNLPWTESVANKGIGVFDSLKLIGKIVIDGLNKKYSRLSRGAGAGATSRTTTPSPIAQQQAPRPIQPQQQQQYQQQQPLSPQTHQGGTTPAAPAYHPPAQREQPAVQGQPYSLPGAGQQYTAPRQQEIRPPITRQQPLASPPSPSPAIAGQQQYGFVNFEPLPVGPSNSS
jgi:signal recognition particle receptor subunit beta